LPNWLSYSSTPLQDLELFAKGLAKNPCKIFLLAVKWNYTPKAFFGSPKAALWENKIYLRERVLPHDFFE